jgi:probable FeS assembly SUF system protein SufT
MHENTEHILRRDTEAIQIPSGNGIVLEKDLRVIITQSLGGTYTVASEYGLARISAADADALGLNKPETAATAGGEGVQLDEKAVWDQLRTCYDPEIPVNIVDLGLVYDCSISERPEGATVLVKMTLTAPGCGMGPAIAAEARDKILSLPGVTDADVELVWDPPWNQDMISEGGKMRLGMI